MAVILSALFIYDLSVTRQKNVAEAQAWKVDGPPCPTTTRAEFEAQGFRTRKTTEYDGFVLGRQAGNVQCNQVASKGGTGFGKVRTCEFTAPAVLTVGVDGQETAFMIGAGQPATIVMGDEPQCFLSGDKYIGQK